MDRNTVVVIGNGMVGQRFLRDLIDAGGPGRFEVVVLCEEPYAAYDRVNLSSYFRGVTIDDLSLRDVGVAADDHIEVRLSTGATAIELIGRTVTTTAGDVIDYDVAVFASGSSPFVPPIPGIYADGSFVYRTIEDLDAISAYSKACDSGVVIGGGLLGLEAAGALRSLGLRTDIVEFAPQLMPAQLDDIGAELLANEIRDLGIGVHTGMTTEEIVVDDRSVTGLRFDDGTRIATDMVVVSAGIRPRDELARDCGLELGERGGIAIDKSCRTSDPHVFAIGECAARNGQIFGLVAPGYDMASVAAGVICGGAESFDGADMSAKLKLLGVEVASFGDGHACSDGAQVISWLDPIARVYKKLVVDDDAKKLLGGILVGDTSDYAALHSMFTSPTALPDRPSDLIAPSPGKTALGIDLFGPETTICNCNNVTRATIDTAVDAGELTSVGQIGAETRAGTSCGSCVRLCKQLLDASLAKRGIEVDRSICEHFAYSRQDLFDIVRVRQIRTFRELLQSWGTGRGCAVCKPAVASILAALWNDYVLDNEHAPLQDTNDRFLANMQKDGTYSIVPRVPGGEITPEKLVVLGEVAIEFDLYTKITGAQRIDLFGARVDQLPKIWRRLVNAGFESGHAYGKALRTVKSCVGDTWCRYGVQDSTSLAIDLELRYRGLRSPHKLKSAVSGCARECAEAQGKDFGVVATERGWNLYVCGNGGMKPQHGVLFAEDLGTDTLIRYLDRFLMFYIRTADRLERTATWFNRFEGGVERLRSIVIADSLGICADLEADMARHIQTYRCEWAKTLEDAAALARFTHFVNDDGNDPMLSHARERNQRRPVSLHRSNGAHIDISATKVAR